MAEYKLAENQFAVYDGSEVRYVNAEKLEEGQFVGIAMADIKEKTMDQSIFQAVVIERNKEEEDKVVWFATQPILADSKEEAKRKATAMAVKKCKTFEESWEVVVVPFA